MSVVATAAVGPAGGVYGPQLCGSGARKRKDLLAHEDQDVRAEEEEISRRRGNDESSFLAATVPQPPHHAGLFVLERVEEEEEEEERSSIGAASEEDSRDEKEGDEADSSGDASSLSITRRRTKQQDALACMDALDDALPIKRGLSNFFSGKSRSFANLQDAAVTTARDLAKPENPFNKRRRVLHCTSIRRVASTSLTALPPFLPSAGGNNNGKGSG